MIVRNKCSFVSLFALCLLGLVSAQQRYYDRKYDYYDSDHLIENPRLLRKYLDCFLEQGPCTPIGRVFRQLLPEVVVTACKKCSPSQRRLAKKTFDAFRWYFPDTYEELMNKLDPKHKYFEAFEKAINDA